MFSEYKKNCEIVARELIQQKNTTKLQHIGHRTAISKGPQAQYA